MPATIHFEPDNICRMEIRGTLRKTDLERCQEALADEMRRRGPMRLLCVLDGFEGWERQDVWNDLSFFIEHGSTIERIAIVGDERWKGETLMFAGADLRRAPVEFFATEAVADARTWLSA